MNRCSAADTEALGAELAATLAPGDVVLVEGELGAGKTTFVRGACRALGVTALVTSPTFTIGQRYEAPVPVSHVDLFRVDDLGGEDPDLLDGLPAAGHDRVRRVAAGGGERSWRGSARSWRGCASSTPGAIADRGDRMRILGFDTATPGDGGRRCGIRSSAARRVEARDDPRPASGLATPRG